MKAQYDLAIRIRGEINWLNRGEMSIKNIYSIEIRYSSPQIINENEFDKIKTFPNQMVQSSLLNIYRNDKLQI